VKDDKEDAMTVAELIEQLQRLPADLSVYIADWNEGYAPDCPDDCGHRAKSLRVLRPSARDPRAVTARASVDRYDQGADE
jgi:hypothetical protein